MLKSRRYFASGLNVGASFLEGLATPWLFLAVNSFHLRWVWPEVSVAGASRASAIITATWLVYGYLMLPVFRRAARHAKSNMVWIAVALAVPFVRFFLVWNGGRFGSTGIFLILERACSWAIYFGEPVRPGKLSARLLQYGPWFGGVIFGWGLLNNAVNWFENDAASYIVLSGLIGTAAAGLKIAGMFAAGPARPTGNDQITGTTGGERPRIDGRNSWIPLVLIYALLLVAASLPKDLSYLSPQFGRYLGYWGTFGGSMLVAGFIFLVIIPEEWLSLGPLAGVVLLLMAGLPSPASLVLLGSGLGALSACVVEWNPGYRIPIIWMLGVILLVDEIGIYHSKTVHSPWLLAGAAVAVMAALFAARRELLSPLK